MRGAFAGSRLVIASHNPGKVEEIAALLAPFAIETVAAGGARPPEPEETGDSFEANAALEGRGRRRGRAGCRRSPMIPVSSFRRWAARRGSTRPAGPGRTKDFASAMARVHRELGERGPRRLVCRGSRSRLARRRDRAVPRRGRGLPHLAAARRSGVRLRPDVRARGRQSDLRRNGPRREAPDQPPRPRLRQARRREISQRVKGPDPDPNPPPLAGEGVGGAGRLTRTRVRERRARRR